MTNHPTGPAARERVLTKDDIHQFDALARAGVVFRQYGPSLQPPWYARHRQLPAKFETPEAAEDEDYKRVKMLIADGSPAACRLATLIDPCRLAGPYPTLASSRYYRWARVRFVAGVDHWLRQHPDETLHAFTLIPPAAFAEAGGLHDPQYGAPRLRARFRKHFDLLGLDPADGWLIGGLHASFEQGHTERLTGYQFHMHGLCNAAMIPTIEALRATSSYAKTPRVHGPIQTEPVSQVEPWVTYMAQSYWPQRNALGLLLPGSRVRSRSRLPKPHHTEMLIWLHQQRFGDLVMMRGGNIPEWARRHVW